MKAGSSWNSRHFLSETSHFDTSRFLGLSLYCRFVYSYVLMSAVWITVCNRSPCPRLDCTHVTHHVCFCSFTYIYWWQLFFFPPHLHQCPLDVLLRFRKPKSIMSPQTHRRACQPLLSQCPLVLCLARFGVL